MTPESGPDRLSAFSHEVLAAAAERLRLSTERLKAQIELNELELRAERLREIEEDDPEFWAFVVAHPELYDDSNAP